MFNLESNFYMKKYLISGEDRILTEKRNGSQENLKISKLPRALKRNEDDSPFQSRLSKMELDD